MEYESPTLLETHRLCKLKLVESRLQLQIMTQTLKPHTHRLLSVIYPDLSPTVGYVQSRTGDDLAEWNGHGPFRIFKWYIYFCFQL